MSPNHFTIFLISSSAFIQRTHKFSSLLPRIVTVRKTFRENVGESRVVPGIVNFHEYGTGLRDAQMADKTLFFGVWKDVMGRNKHLNQSTE